MEMHPAFYFNLHTPVRPSLLSLLYTPKTAGTTRYMRGSSKADNKIEVEALYACSYPYGDSVLPSPWLAAAHCEFQDHHLP